jgi:hypothetical protein
MTFFKNGKHEGRTGPVWGVGTRGRGEDIRKRMGAQIWWNIMHSCMKMEK